MHENKLNIAVVGVGWEADSAVQPTAGGARYRCPAEKWKSNSIRHLTAFPGLWAEWKLGLIGFDLGSFWVRFGFLLAFYWL